MLSLTLLTLFNKILAHHVKNTRLEKLVNFVKQITQKTGKAPENLNKEISEAILTMLCCIL